MFISFPISVREVFFFFSTEVYLVYSKPFLHMGPYSQGGCVLGATHQGLSVPLPVLQWSHFYSVSHRAPRRGGSVPDNEEGQAYESWAPTPMSTLASLFHGLYYFDIISKSRLERNV